MRLKTITKANLETKETAKITIKTPIKKIAYDTEPDMTTSRSIFVKIGQNTHSNINLSELINSHFYVIK